MIDDLTPHTDRSDGPTRRTVLVAGAFAAATPLLGFHFAPAARAQDAAVPGARIPFDAWIAVEPDGAVVIQVSQAEMGQGIHTTFPAIIADEMDADWAKVRLEMPGHDAAYFNPNFPQMFTGNAESTRTFWPVIRRAGATAREMLAQAAAERMSVPRAELKTIKSNVVHEATGRQLSYGEVAEAASRIVLAEDPPLKVAEEWVLLRRSLPRRDLRAKVTGAPVFGLDASIKGMVYAAIRHAETPSGAVARIDRPSLDGMSGILDVVELPGAVAVVARNTWAALEGAQRLDVTFTPGVGDDFSSESLDALYAETIDGDRWTEAESEGDAPSAIAAATDVHEAEYHSAWQAHATMEPMNAIADVRDGSAYILAPTQGQTVTAHRVAAALDIPVENVAVERTFLGGGFGRRLIADYAAQAALVSRAVGRPVQLVWSREQDMRHGHFRPHVRNRLAAALGPDGLPVALDQQVVSPTILSPVIAQPTRLVYPQIEPSVVEGMTAETLLYGFGHTRLRAHLLDVPLPTMVWRTTGFGPNVFAVESFIDELARRIGADPFDYRIAMLRRTAESVRAGDESAEATGNYRNVGGAETRSIEASRAIAVLEALRRHAGPARGQAVGIAYSHCFATHIAQAVDVSVDADGTLDIHRVVSVLDGGYVLDPDITRANIEGGIHWGLTQALTSEITFSGGRADQANYDTFEILALPEAPPVEHHWIDSGHDPGGLGEVGPVPTAPALVNAIAQVAGRRLRTLPLARHGIHTRWRKQFLPPARDPSEAPE